MANDDVRVPAGWYPDPLGLPQLRWWDNHSWTEHTSDARQPIVEEEVLASVSRGRQQTPGLKMADAGPQLMFADDDPFADDLADLETTGFAQPAYPVHNLDSAMTGATDLPSRRDLRAQERLIHEDDVIRDLAGDAPRFADPLSALEAPAQAEGVIADSPAMRFAATSRIDDAPRSMRYDLEERHEDLLGEPSIPRSAFDHASSTTTNFVPDSTTAGAAGAAGAAAAAAKIEFDALRYGAMADAATQYAPQNTGAAHHAAGRRVTTSAIPTTSTVPAWLLTLIPVYMLLVGMVVLLSGTTAAFAPITLLLVIGVPWLAGIGVAAVDHRSLKNGGMEQPAHWLWSVLGAPVYLVARLVATVREAGNGFGPVLTFIVLGLLTFGAVIAVPGLVMELAPAQFAAEAERSIEDDARSFGAQLTVDCPDTPPLLVQQSFTCTATNTQGETFNVRVSLQRSNGWIAWRVDDWGVFVRGA